MKATSLVLAAALLAGAGLVAAPSAAAIDCTGGIPPQVDPTVQCAVDIVEWALDKLDDLPPPGESP